MVMCPFPHWLSTVTSSCFPPQTACFPDYPGSCQSLQVPFSLITISCVFPLLEVSLLKHLMFELKINKSLAWNPLMGSHHGARNAFSNPGREFETTSYPLFHLLTQEKINEGGCQALKRCLMCIFAQLLRVMNNDFYLFV